NYLFGVGLACAAAALWLVIQNRIARLVVGFVSCVVLIFCHMEAFGVYALIVGGVELHRGFAAWRLTKSWQPVFALLGSAAPFVLTLALFSLLSPTAKVIGSGFGYDPGLGTKPVGALFSLASGIFWLDGIRAASIAGLCGWLLAKHRLAISMPLATALACLLVALFALPSSLMGSLYSDIRLGPAIALVAISTLDIRADAPRVITN